MINSNKKRILILLGHSDQETFCGFLANAYEKEAKQAGHDVRRLNIGELKFDPVLHKGYKEIQELEEDLDKVQEYIKWSNHFILFYPNWWGTMPALLKGLFDRIILPGFAFRFHKGKSRWEKLLIGKSARVIITTDMQYLKTLLFFGSITNVIKKSILEFSGFSPVNITQIGPIKNMTDAEKERWEEKIIKLANGAK